ncbi:hypothetical protein ACWGOK_40845 [Streptomyces eurythermus]
MTTNDDDGQPRYATFPRSEARLRPDQMAKLDEVRRQVSRARSDKRERITNNTLLRLAVDLLLANSAHIKGDTEEEMRRSLLGGGRHLSGMNFQTL